jgi:hypothetical protein
MAKKKTCDGCKAFYTSSHDSAGLGTCRLNYAFDYEIKKVCGIILYLAHPTENCPKPRTLTKYIELSSLKKSSN